MKIKLSKIRKKINSNKLEVILVLIFIPIVFWVYATSTPFDFEDDTIIEIERGQSLKEISQMLEDKNIINSKMIFNSLALLTNKDDKMISGEYVINKKLSIFDLLRRLSIGDYGIDLRSTTLNEGMTRLQMANFLELQYRNFNSKAFLRETKDLEGYLFPDTYFFPTNVNTESIIMTLTGTFNEKLREISYIIESSDKSLSEIIIMASIIEKESTAEARQEVSNILWKRIDIGMPLQVDATFVYERGLGTFDLTEADLMEDSPYNTYTRSGLPPTPIANPGIESIKAAAHPQETENLFFLTGLDGEMYYAETFAVHKQNKAKYLR